MSRLCLFALTAMFYGAVAAAIATAIAPLLAIAG
jgi:hypothetical protein